MKNPLCLFAFFIIALLPVKGQNVIIKEFGADSLINSGKAVIQRTGGSIYFAGHAQDSLNRWMIHFSKLDQNGNLIFTRYFKGPSGQALMERMQNHPDGTFLISSTSIDSTNFTEPMLMKIDSTGTLIWQKTYSNGNANGSLLGLTTKANGEILASGFTTDIGFPYIGFLCVRTDADGNQLQNLVFSDVNTIMTSDVCSYAAPNEIILSGDIKTSNTTFSAHVLKADTNGNQLWETTVSYRLNGGCKNEMIDSNNDLVVIGECSTDSSPNFDIQMTKIDIQTGAIKWMKFLRATNESDAGFSILETVDHNYLVAGYGYDTVSMMKKVVLVLTDSSGNEIKKKYYGTGLANIGFDVRPSVDGQYLVAGSNYTNGKNILILDSPANWTSITTINRSAFKIFPTVLKAGELLQMNQPLASFSILDDHGRVCFEHQSAQKIESFNTGFLAGGTYFLLTSINGQRFAEKFIVQ